MVHCPECGTSLEDTTDVAFTEADAKMGFIEASKRYYTANCAACGRVLGSGVAGARGNPGAGAT